MEFEPVIVRPTSSRNDSLSSAFFPLLPSSELMSKDSTGDSLRLDAPLFSEAGNDKSKNNTLALHPHATFLTMRVPSSDPLLNPAGWIFRAGNRGELRTITQQPPRASAIGSPGSRHLSNLGPLIGPISPTIIARRFRPLFVRAPWIRERMRWTSGRMPVRGLFCAAVISARRKNCSGENLKVPFPITAPLTLIGLSRPRLDGLLIRSRARAVSGAEPNGVLEPRLREESISHDQKK